MEDHKIGHNTTDLAVFLQVAMMISLGESIITTGKKKLIHPQCGRRAKSTLSSQTKPIIVRSLA